MRVPRFSEVVNAEREKPLGNRSSLDVPTIVASRVRRRVTERERAALGAALSS